MGRIPHSPDRFLVLLLQAVASPMMAAPALAALMGLDATLVLATLITSTALIPLTPPLFVGMLLGGGPTFTPGFRAARDHLAIDSQASP